MKYRSMFFLLLLIIILSIILVVKIKKTPKYSLNEYNQVYEEFAQINSMKKSNQKKYKTKSNFEIIKNSRGENYKTIATLKIDKIALDCPIISKYSESNIKIAPARLIGPDPNESGNLVIVGHNYKNKEMFSELYKLNKNDEIVLKDRKNGEVIYKIYEIKEVSGKDFSCVKQNANNKKEVTLITCALKNRNKRLVIKSVEKL